MVGRWWVRRVLNGWWWKSEDSMGLGEETRVAEDLGVEVSAVYGAVDLEYFDEADGDLFFDVIDEHNKVFALLGVCGFQCCDGYDSAVVFHDERGECDLNVEFLAEEEEEDDVFDKCVDSAHFRMHRRSGYECLLLAAIVECAGRADEADAVAGLALAVEVDKVAGVDFTVELEWEGDGALE